MRRKDFALDKHQESFWYIRSSPTLVNQHKLCIHNSICHKALPLRVSDTWWYVLCGDPEHCYPTPVYSGHGDPYFNPFSLFRDISVFCAPRDLHLSCSWTAPYNLFASAHFPKYFCVELVKKIFKKNPRNNDLDKTKFSLSAPSICFHLKCVGILNKNP